MLFTALRVGARTQVHRTSGADRTSVAHLGTGASARVDSGGVSVFSVKWGSTPHKVPIKQVLSFLNAHDSCIPGKFQLTLKL